MQPGRHTFTLEKQKDSVCHDILLLTCQITTSVDTLTTQAIYNRFIFLEDLNMAVGDQGLNVSLNPSDRNENACPDPLILRVTPYNIHRLKQYIVDNKPLLNSDQADVCNFFLENIYTHTGRIILDTPSGTGKTFLLNLLAKLRHNGDLAIVGATSGIALTLLDGGWTTQSTCKLSFNVVHQEKLMCHIVHSLDKVRILKKCNLIVWDEATMSHKCSLYV